MRTATTLMTCLVALGGCQAGGPRAAVESTEARGAWTGSFEPPLVLDTERVHLEPLTPAHAELDHEAFMSSREHLQRTLHWGSWPRPDTTVEDNRGDLARHAREFVAREAYAYTVLRPDRAACLGCVYLDPVDDAPSAVQMNYWVTAAGVEAGLDAHLFEAVLRWLEGSWPFDAVRVEVHVDNPRGIEIAQDAGLVRTTGARDDHVALVWLRPR